MAYAVMAHIVMAYTVMAHIVMAYTVMAHIVMAYTVMALLTVCRGWSCGAWSWTCVEACARPPNLAGYQEAVFFFAGRRAGGGRSSWRRMRVL